LEKKHEKYQNTLWNLLITQISMWKCQNTCRDRFFFFLIFSKVKNVLSLYMDHEKP
jgi:hypothetical protein